MSLSVRGTPFRPFMLVFNFHSGIISNYIFICRIEWTFVLQCFAQFNLLQTSGVSLAATKNHLACLQFACSINCQSFTIGANQIQLIVKRSFISNTKWFVQCWADRSNARSSYLCQEANLPSCSVFSG